MGHGDIDNKYKENSKSVFMEDFFSTYMRVVENLSQSISHQKKFVFRVTKCCDQHFPHNITGVSNSSTIQKDSKSSYTTRNVCHVKMMTKKFTGDFRIALIL